MVNIVECCLWKLNKLERQSYEIHKHVLTLFSVNLYLLFHGHIQNYNKKLSSTKTNLTKTVSVAKSASIQTVLHLSYLVKPIIIGTFNFIASTCRLKMKRKKRKLNIKKWYVLYTFLIGWDCVKYMILSLQTSYQKTNVSRLKNIGAQ